MKTRTFRFIRKSEIEAYEATGWVDLHSLTDTHHGEWATLMEFRGVERDEDLQTCKNTVE